MPGLAGAEFPDARHDFRHGWVEAVVGIHFDARDLEVERVVVAPGRCLLNLEECGLILVARGRHRGLLLPQVPAHHGLDVEGFIEALCRKAGLPRRRWVDDPAVSLLGFEAEVWAEGEADPGRDDERRR